MFFKLRKKLKAYALERKEKQDFRILNNKDLSYTYEHIQTDYNPFIYVGKHQVKYLEDIKINYDDYFDGAQTIEYIVRYPYLGLKQRKILITEIIKKWEVDYYKSIDDKLKRMFEQASYIPVKNVQMIKNRQVYLYMAIALFFFVLLKQYSFFQFIPYIGGIFAKINYLLILRRYYNITSIIVYLSIIISMYLIIVKVYFDKVLKYGLSAKGFLIKERDRMLRKFKPNIRVIKNHLYKIAKKGKVEQKFPLDQLYNTNTIVNRIQKYGRTVIKRVGIFTSYYKTILSISKFIRIILYCLIIYLVFSLIFVSYGII